jgi:hypothetical protein
MDRRSMLLYTTLELLNSTRPESLPRHGSFQVMHWLYEKLSKDSCSVSDRVSYIRHNAMSPQISLE